MCVVGPCEARPAEGLAIDFVVQSDRAQLSEIVQRVRDGRLRTNIGTVATLDNAVAASIRPSGSAGRRSSKFVTEAYGSPAAANLQLPAELAVERIRAAAAQRDGEADQAPQQHVFVAALEPSETVAANQ